MAVGVPSARSSVVEPETTAKTSRRRAKSCCSRHRRTHAWMRTFAARRFRSASDVGGRRESSWSQSGGGCFGAARELAALEGTLDAFECSRPRAVGPNIDIGVPISRLGTRARQ